MSKIKIFALGGLNEIGKNMYCVEVDKDLFIFDAGLKYSSDNMLGVDYIIPNYDYIKDNKKRIKGLFISPFGLGIFSIILSNNLSTPTPVLALVRTISSLSKPIVSNSSITLSGSALGRSILLITGIIVKSFSKAR